MRSVHYDSASTAALLRHAFAARDLTGLCSALGFDAPPVEIPDVVAPLALRHAGVIRAFLRAGRGALVCYELHTCQTPAAAELAGVCRALRARNFAQLQLCVIAGSDFGEIVLASYGLGEQLLTLRLRSERLHASDLEALQEMLPADGECGSALAARHARALDRTRVSRRFFADFAAQRDRVSAAWRGISPQARRDRQQLALLLLSRLMFLYFLQHRGYLAGDSNYLVRRLSTWRGKRTFFRGALRPLFFGVLNRRPERRPPSVRTVGALPYLNGGLFEPHVLERKHTQLDLDDATLTGVVHDLFERYRFTAHEASDTQLAGVHDVGVDPEMLGRVFEGLMAERVRATTGTFYTPAATVDRLVYGALAAHLSPRIGDEAATSLIRDGDAQSFDAYQRRLTSSVLRETRVLDPACGSGAFLLSSLARIAQARAALDDCDEMTVRRDVVAHSLFGVDVQSDAALLCALRLWLALVPGAGCQPVQPLPNLDRHIRQGDSLLDPLDLHAAAPDVDVRAWMRRLEPLSASYLSAEPEQRLRVARTLGNVERGLARAWIASHLRRTNHELSELRAAAQQNDLFGALTAEARAARSALRAVSGRRAELCRLARGLRVGDERPFFSFAVHFPNAALHGFDIVLCNPPWVRSHNWPRTITRLVRQRFEVCRDTPWHPAHSAGIPTAGGNQIDLALLFLERSLDLLAPGGILGIILPAKFLRSLSGAPARRMLLERTHLVRVEDHSLDQRSIFAADAFAALIVARKRAKQDESVAAPARIISVRRNRAPLEYAADQTDLPLFSNDARAPWLLVPADVRRALQRMQESPPVGARPALSIRRGVVTGANRLMVLIRADPKLGNLTAIRSEGFLRAVTPAHFEGVVESGAVGPLLRGCDINAWKVRRNRFLLCRPPGTVPQLPRLSKYLEKHGFTLADLTTVDPAATCLAWQDLASTLEAVVVSGKTVALNTVYFIAADEDTAHLLCAYFNSLPLRTFARAIAERAKDAYFRFFACTISILPLPAHWRSFEAARLRELSFAAHADGAMDHTAQAELDAIVARAFNLTSTHSRALRFYDDWLRST